MSKNGAPFITFEGGEGSGKSTQVEILNRTLLQADIDVLSLREPGGTPGAEHIRELVLHRDTELWTPVTEALLMSASRSDLVSKRLIPALDKGVWVLCDRFTDSTLAYQGFGHKLGYEAIDALNHFTVSDLKPDLTFVFELNPELGLERAEVRDGAKDRIEAYDINFHRRVAEGFAEVIKRNPDRCISINALLDIDIISKQILQEVDRRFGKQKSASV